MGSGHSYPSLSNDDLDFLQTQTGQDMTKIKQQYQIFKDGCPSGKLTFVDSFVMYKELFPTQPGVEFCQHAFRALDTDSDGFIDFKEFLLMVNLTTNVNAKEKLELAFIMYDVDGNGVIDPLEMTKVLQVMHNAYNTGNTTPTNCKYRRKSLKEGVMSVFNILDENNDGQITEEEFVAGCLQDNYLSQLLAPQFLQ